MSFFSSAVSLATDSAPGTMALMVPFAADEDRVGIPVEVEVAAGDGEAGIADHRELTPLCVDERLAHALGVLTVHPDDPHLGQRPARRFLTAHRGRQRGKLAMATGAPAAEEQQDDRTSRRRRRRPGPASVPAPLRRAAVNEGTGPPRCGGPLLGIGPEGGEEPDPQRDGEPPGPPRGRSCGACAAGGAPAAPRAWQRSSPRQLSECGL